MSKAEAGSSHHASTSSPSTPPVHNSGHAAATHAGSTGVEDQSSSNMLITGGSFVRVEEGGMFQTHTYLKNGTKMRKGMRKLGKMIAPGASHNSAERYDPPKCHARTREAVLKEIMDWVKGLDDLERRCYFMWLYGPAGAGKSAIAQTIAELCHELKLLAASFFFSRTAAGRSDHSRLIATIAYQLCLSIPEVRTHVEDAVELDPNIFSLSPENQLQKLIVEPLSHIHDDSDPDHSHIHSRLIIIDGLDECSSADYVQRHVLQILAERLPIPMLFLVASRPEPHIRGFFTAEPMASITTTLALDDSYHPDVDIKIFLKSKFDAIKRDHPLRHRLPQSWPSATDVDQLVRKSSGQFIYASTVMKYVESHRHWPTDRLMIILGIMSRGKDTPFADLDSLYTLIFSFVVDINKVLDIFSVLLLMTTRRFLKSPANIEALLGLRSGDLEITLIDLHSILDIPDLTYTYYAGEIRVLHASLGDFLLDQTRSGDYHINQNHAHAKLTQYLIRCIPQNAIGNHENFHILSSAIFTLHCTQSFPTAELLDALWSFDAFGFWTFYFSETWDQLLQYELREISPTVSRPSQLSDFFTWLKANGSIREGRDLYSHYILAWDKYIQHSLTQLSLQPRETQYIIFSVLPQFRGEYQAENIFTQDTFGAEYLSAVSSSLEFHHDDRYDLMLQEFFSDPSRSGPFHLDGNKYASFAITFAKYLIVRPTSRSIAKDWGHDLFCLSILLSKASYSQELATLLDSRLLKLIKARRRPLAQKAADIVKAYCNSSSDNHYAALHVEGNDIAMNNGELNSSEEDATPPSSRSSPTPRLTRGTKKGRSTRLAHATLKVRKIQARSRETSEANGEADPPKRSLRLKLKGNMEALADPPAVMEV